MSCVIVVTPIVIASWPVIAAAVTASIGSMGFALAGEDRVRRRAENTSKTRTEIDVEDSEILEGTAGSGEEMVVEKDGIRAIFSRDGRGALKVCMEGEGVAKSELRRIGEELIARVTQQYVYHRIVTELKSRHMTIVDEEVAADRTVKIRVRNQ